MLGDVSLLSRNPPGNPKFQVRIFFYHSLYIYFPLNALNATHGKNIFLLITTATIVMGFPYSSVGKESACSAGDPGWEDAPGEGNGSPLQNTCLENPTDSGAWQATVHGVARVGHDLATKPRLPQQ